MKKREYKEHKAVEPIPDRDWVGETWGLYWPDLEEYEELLHHPIEPKKHKDAPGFVPACDTCKVCSVVIAECPKPKEKTPSPPPPSPPPPPPPKVVIREPTPPRNPTPEPVKPRSPTPPRRPQTPPPTRQHYSPPPRPKVIPTSRRSSEARVVGLIKPSRREPRVIVPTVQKPKPVAVPVPAPEPVKPVVVVQPKSVTPPPTPVRPTPVSFYSKEKKPSRKPEPVLPPPPPELFNKERDNSKWGWMKDRSDAGKSTRFRLSVYF